MNNRKCFLRLFLCLSFGWGVLALNAQTVSKSFNDTPLKTVLKEVEKPDGIVCCLQDRRSGCEPESECIIPESLFG